MPSDAAVHAPTCCHLCPVVRCRSLPRSDSSSLTTLVGAWICWGLVISGGSPSPFGGGRLSGGGSMLARHLDSLVACVLVSVAGDLGKVFCPQ